MDKEVTDKRPEFKTFDLAERLARICIELQENDAAIRTSNGIVPVWITSVAIEMRIGGAKVAQNDRLKFSRGAKATLLNHFQNLVKVHLKERLASMLKTEEALFQMYNAGTVKIGTIDPGGQYRWVLSDEIHCVDERVLENKRTTH